jgi:Fur family ferric uptake transcriptional regulator
MSSADTDLLKQLLSKDGFSLTGARMTVFRLLKDRGPQSVAELQAKSNGAIDRVSIYRNLDLFEKLGIVRRLYSLGKYKYELSDKFTAHHHHLTCLSCGRVIDVQDEEHIDSFIKHVSKEFGFKPLRHQFEVEGYCPACADRNAG